MRVRSLMSVMFVVVRVLGMDMERFLFCGIVVYMRGVGMVEVRVI